MLRPATPLSIVLLVAFGLLVLSVISTPIIKGIPLGTFEGASFGVFGFCKADGTCTGIEIGYDTSNAIPSNDFDLPASTRTTLSSILIIHPVAALITLIMLVLAIISHTHSASHSSRYLLLVFIFSIIDFLVCLLAFLVDVLLFVPHMAFGTYFVLAATILVALAGLVSCAMRRTVVGRKARKKQIAANAEMSGQNFYNRQAQEVQSPPTAATLEPTMPMVSGANGTGDNKLPEFATFDRKDDLSSDERIPLTAVSPTDRSPNTLVNSGSTVMSDMPYNGPIGPNQPRRSMSNSTLGRDPYGNPMVPQDAYGVRRGPSMERMNGRGRGGMPPGGYRGRGGYSGPGRGGYNGYGPPPNGRGGYGPPGRGGYGTPPGRGGYGPPPRGYGPGPGMRGGRPPPPAYQGERRGSPAGAYGSPPGSAPYGARQASPGPPSAPGYSMNNSAPNLPAGGYEAYNPERESLPRAESPPPLPGADEAMPGQAVEMDARTGSPKHPPAGFGQFGIRESDADIAGMLAMQQGMGPASGPRRHDTYMSDMSRYSQDDGYVPPRQAWNQGPGRNSPSVPSPLNVARNGAPSRGSPAPQPPSAPASEYYEDVDPRFTAEVHPHVEHRPTPPPIQTTNTYEAEDIPQGARSPAESERSTFTSISQRGVNPRWNPGPPPPRGGFGGPMIPRRPVNRPADMLLSSNPDFELPPRGGSARSGAGMIPGSAYPAI